MKDKKSDISQERGEKSADDARSAPQAANREGSDETIGGNQDPGDSGTTSLGGEPADTPHPPPGGVEGIRDNS